MWKLWASAWLKNRRVAEQRRPAVVEAPRTDWRPWLAAVLSRVLRVEVSEEGAPAQLEALNSEQLLALDVALRLRQWVAPEAMPKLPANPAAPDWPGGEAGACCLFVLACHGNGFIRQEALRQFRRYPQRLALAAALIRATDWVPQVQAESALLLENLSTRLSPDTWIDLLDLLIALQRRARLPQSVWRERILPVLLAPEARDGRWRWAAGGSWRVRVFALQLIIDAEPANLHAALHLAVSSEAPPVALWAIKLLEGVASDSKAELLRLAAAHPSAAVRAAAVRATATVDPDFARPLLLNAVFDLSRGSRSAAAWALEERFGLSARTLWRQALAEEGSPRSKSALLGLCDAPEAEDTPLLCLAAGHQSAAVRCAALRGLSRSNAPMLEEQLARALSDGARVVVNQSLKLFRHGVVTLNPVVLMNALRTSKSATGDLLIRGVRLLGKWEGLDVLLSIYYANDPMRVYVAEELALWLIASNKRFTTPAPAVLLRIRGSLARLHLVLPDWIEVSLQSIVEHA